MAHARALLTVRALVALAFAAALGCGGAAPPPPHAEPRRAPSTAASAAPVEERDPIAAGQSFTTFTSARFDLALPLPGGASFRVDDSSERWLVATHEATSSRLLVRAWREDAIMNRARCEERARSWRSDVPPREETRLLEAIRVGKPADHDTMAEVRLGKERAPAEGFVLAFGGWARRCFAYVFTTKGADERVVAARLATMVSGSLSRMRFESELDPSRSRAR